MKKFMLLHFGYDEPTPEVMDAWKGWFASIADKIADMGSPLGPGRVISAGGTTELPMDADAITGYTIINAQDIDEAERIAQGCPLITSVRVYEMRSMQHGSRVKASSPMVGAAAEVVERTHRG